MVNDENKECLELRLISEYKLDHGELKKPEVCAEYVLERKPSVPIKFVQGKPVPPYLKTFKKFDQVFGEHNGGVTSLIVLDKESTMNDQVYVSIDVQIKNVMGLDIYESQQHVEDRSTTVEMVDVDGTVFRVRRKTLKNCEGMFQVYLILEGYAHWVRDANKHIYMDRSPKHFDLILNFMRDGKVVLPESDLEVQEIMREAEYYWMTGLYDLCSKHLERNKKSQIVRLDVGGVSFKTTKATLTRFDGMFKTMLENDSPTSDPKRVYFIDRSPKHFDLILNYMRDGDVELPMEARDVKKVLKEAQYYLLAGLADKCQNLLENVALP